MSLSKKYFGQKQIRIVQQKRDLILCYFDLYFTNICLGSFYRSFGKLLASESLFVAVYCHCSPLCHCHWCKFSIMLSISLRHTAGAASRLLILSSKFNSFCPLNVSQGSAFVSSRAFRSSRHFAQRSQNNKLAGSNAFIEDVVVPTSTQTSIAESTDMVNLRIKLFSSNTRLLEYYEKYFTFYFQAMNPKSYKLPTRRKTFVLLKSPHVNKKAKEHFFFEGNYRVVEVELSKRRADYVMNLMKNVHNLDVKFSYMEK